MTEGGGERKSSRRSRSRESQEKPQWALGAKEGRFEILAGIVLVLLSLSVFYCEPGFNRPFRHLPVLLASLVTAGSAYFLIRIPLNFYARLTFVSLAAWWAASLLSALGTIDSFLSQRALISWGGGLGVFTLASTGFRSGRAWRKTIIGLLGACLLFCVTGWISKGPGQMLKATFINQDTFSFVPMTACFLGLTLTQSPRRWQRVLTAAVSVFFGFCVLATGSRAGALGLLGGTSAWLVALALHHSKTYFRKASTQVAFGLLLLLLLGAASGALGGLFSRFGDALNGKDIQGLTMRHDVLVYGLQTSRRHPLLGYGPGTFAQAYQSFRPRGTVPDYIFVNYAHNDYIEMLVEIGWPGFLAWLCFSFLVLARGVRLIRFGLATWESSCLIGATVAMAVFTTLNFVLPVPAVFIWQMLILGMLHGLPAGLDPVTPVPRIQGLAGGLLILQGLVFSFLSLKNLVSDQLVRESTKLTQALRWEDAMTKLDQAVSWLPHNTGALLERANLYSRRGAFSSDKSLQTKAEADYQLAAELSPGNQELMRNRIAFYSARRNYSRAEELLERAHRDAPYQEWHLLQLTRVRLLQGKLAASARSLYEDSLNDQKAQKALPAVLVEIERQNSDTGIALLEEWSGREGDAGISLRLGKDSAERALDIKDPYTADRFLAFVLKQSPKDTKALYLRAQAYRMEGKDKERRAVLASLAALSGGSKRDPYIDSALVDIATFQKLHLYTPAFQSLERRLKTDPKSVPLRLAVAQAYLNDGKLDPANEILSVGLDLNPDDDRLLAKMGTCLAMQSLPDLARSYFEQALKIDRRNKEARQGVARLPKG